MKKLIDDSELQDNRVEKKSHAGIIITVILLVIVLFGCISVYSGIKRFTSTTVSSAERKHLDKKDAVITVEQGDSVKEIARKLKQQSIIDNPTQFMYLCKRENRGSSFQPGEYTVNNYMDFNEICDVLESGYVEKEYVNITIKEGMWASEIAAYLEEQGLCTYDEFMEAANSSDYDYSFIADIPTDRGVFLEGYLFPDTYNITVGSSAKEIVDKMLSRFDDIFTPEYKEQAKIQGKTMDQIVIAASLIEAEVNNPDERKLVSSVINNRIEKNMKLQLDASVLYALGEHRRVLNEDLKVEDEHNTYYVTGLPIGPISNPGAACIEAALFPAETDYIYYVLTSPGSNEHFFTASAEEFNAAAERYRSQLD